MDLFHSCLTVKCLIGTVVLPDITQENNDQIHEHTNLRLHL